MNKNIYDLSIEKFYNTETEIENGVQIFLSFENSDDIYVYKFAEDGEVDIDGWYDFDNNLLTENQFNSLLAKDISFHSSLQLKNMETINELAPLLTETTSFIDKEWKDYIPEYTKEDKNKILTIGIEHGEATPLIPEPGVKFKLKNNYNVNELLDILNNSEYSFFGVFNNNFSHLIVAAYDDNMYDEPFPYIQYVDESNNVYIDYVFEENPMSIESGWYYLNDDDEPVLIPDISIYECSIADNGAFAASIPGKDPEPTICSFFGTMQTEEIKTEWKEFIPDDGNEGDVLVRTITEVITNRTFKDNYTLDELSDFLGDSEYKGLYFDNKFLYELDVWNNNGSIELWYRNSSDTGDNELYVYRFENESGSWYFDNADKIDNAPALDIPKEVISDLSCYEDIEDISELNPLFNLTTETVKGTKWVALDIVTANPTSYPQDAPMLQSLKVSNNYFKVPEQITVDDSMSDSSTNPVQNNVTKEYIDELVGDIESLLLDI